MSLGIYSAHHDVNDGDDNADDTMVVMTRPMIMLINDHGDDDDGAPELFDEIGRCVVASLPPFPQIWADGQFTIHRKAIKIKQDFSISLQYGMARADIHLAASTRPRYHLHDSVYLNRIPQLVFQLYFSRVFLNCNPQTLIPSS